MTTDVLNFRVNLLEMQAHLRALKLAAEQVERALVRPAMPAARGRDRVEVIKDAAAIYFDVARELIDQTVRTQQVVTARHAAIWFARAFTDLNGVQLGRAFKRDHAAISHALKAVKARLDTDRDFSADIEHLAGAIRGRLGL